MYFQAGWNIPDFSIAVFTIRNSKLASDKKSKSSAVSWRQKSTSKWTKNILPICESQLTDRARGAGGTNPVPFRKLGDTSFNLPPPLSPSQGSHFTKLLCTSALSALGTSRGCWSTSQRPHEINGGWNQPAVLGSNRPLIIRAAMTFLCSAAGIIGAATSCQHHQIYSDSSTYIKELLQKDQTTKLHFSPLQILYF